MLLPPAAVCLALFALLKLPVRGAADCNQAGVPENPREAGARGDETNGHGAAGPGSTCESATALILNLVTGASCQLPLTGAWFDRWYSVF